MSETTNTPEPGTGVQPGAAPPLTPEQLKKRRTDQLNKMMGEPSVMRQFENSLEKNAGAFTASIIDLYNSDANLSECDPKIVIFECLKAASLKLPINKSLGFAWIVAYNGVPAFQMGYKGYIQLALRTGQYKFLNADEVYEGELTKKDKLTGEFDLNGERTSDTVIGYFAHFELLNGFKKTLYMTVAEMNTWGAKYSKTFHNTKGTWKKEFSKMAIKTMLRNLLSHWGIMSVEMATAFDNDQDYDPLENSESLRDDINKKMDNSKTINIDNLQNKTPDADPGADPDNSGSSAIQPNQNFDNSANQNGQVEAPFK